MNNKQSRIDRLMSNGKPRYIRCYDNGGETADQYTVVFTRKFYIGRHPRFPVDAHWFWYAAMSAHPFHPQGVGMFEETIEIIDRPTYSHLGKKIAFNALPKDCQSMVISCYKDLWELGECHVS